MDIDKSKLFFVGSCGDKGSLIRFCKIYKPKVILFVVWYIKWSKEAERLKKLNPEANASKIASILEEKRRTLPEMHTNLRLVVVKNFK